MSSSRLEELLGPPPSTDYLTGLRGLAAVVVYNCHLVQKIFPSSLEPFVSWHRSSFFQLPVVRIIYAGFPMVTLFFALSGLVSSIKPLRLARQRRWTEFAKSLASSVFRRGLRLFLPCLPSTFLVMLAAQLQLFPDDAELAPVVCDNLFWQFADWISFIFNHLLNIRSFDPMNPKSNYGAHLWAVPFEYRGSIIVYVCLLGCAALRPAVFVVFNLAMLVFTLNFGKWDVSLFLEGVLFAHFLDGSAVTWLRTEVKQVLAFTSLFVGVYITSLPLAKGSLWFSNSNMAWRAMGLALIILSVTHNQLLQ